MPKSDILSQSSYYKSNDKFEFFIRKQAFCVGKNVKIEPSLRGKSSFVFFVSDGKDEYIFKFPKTSFSALNLEREQSTSNCLRKYLSCQIPEMIIESDGDRIFSVYKSIPGKNMSDVPLNDIEAETLAYELAEFIVSFHNVPTNAVSYKIGTKKDSILQFCQDFGYVPKFDIISDIFDEQILIHGDYHRSNIILRDDKKLNGVIDFATVSFGSKYFDIGQMVFSMADPFNRFYIAAYEKITNTKLDMDKVQRVVAFLDDMINNNYLPFIRRTRNV